MIKTIVSNVTNRLGYTIVPNWQIDSFASSKHTMRLFDFLSTDLVIDVGANEGQFRDSLRERIGYNGPIISFEPVPRLAMQLTERAKSDPLWTIDCRALGSRTGRSKFHIMADTQFSSFLNPRHDDINIFVESNKITGSVFVSVITLDEILPELMKKYSARSVYLKLDTQGFDLEVLKGAEKSLDIISALQTEASVRPIYAGSPDYQSLVDHLSKRNFVISGIFPNNDGHFPQLVEFDCYMISKNKCK